MELELESELEVENDIVFGYLTMNDKRRAKMIRLDGRLKKAVEMDEFEQ